MVMVRAVVRPEKVDAVMEALMEAGFPAVTKVNVVVDNLAGVERVVLSILNRKTGAIFIENAWGLTDEERIRGVYRMGEGITGYVVQTGDSLVVPNIAAEPAFLDRTGARKDVDTSRLAFSCVPVKLGREVMGTLSVDLSNASSWGLAEDRELLTVVAAMIAQAVQLHRARKEENAQLREENRRLLDELTQKRGPDNIVGNSHPVQALFAHMAKVYDKTTPDLLLGESGTGKELVAAALHYGSLRKYQPFVRFNCAAIPENLAESEMFGHEKGAFTGAPAQRIGRCEEADGGTLFMDAVGELSLPIQAKLLRVLQSRQFERVGGSKNPVGGHTHHRRHQPGPSNPREGRQVPGRTLLSAERLSPPASAVAGARIGYSPPGRPFRGEVRPCPQRAGPPHLHPRHRRPHGLPLARQRPGAGERDRAGRHPLRRRGDPHLPPAAHPSDRRDLRHPLPGHPGGTAGYGGTGAPRGRPQDVPGNMAQAARELGLSERVIALRVQKHGIDFRLFRPKTQN